MASPLFCHLQGKPLLSPHLRGTQRVDATFQGLAQAAVGLLHALHLRGQWDMAAMRPPPSRALTGALLLHTAPGRPQRAGERCEDPWSRARPSPCTQHHPFPPTPQRQ